MWLSRADIPDTGILRRHLIQTCLHGFGVILVGNIYRIQRMRHRHADHGVRQPFNVSHITRNRRVAKIEIQNVRQFVKIAFIHALLAQHSEIAKNSRHHPITVGLAFIRQGGRDSQHTAISVHNRVRICPDTFCQPLFLQPVRKRSRATVTDKIGDQLIRFATKLRGVVINAKFNAQHLARHRRNVVNNDAFLRIGNYRNINSWTFNVFIRHPAKGINRNFRQFRQRAITVNHRFHQIGRIVFFVKREQRFVHRTTGLITQRFEVTTREACARVRRVDGLRAHLRHTHPVTGTRHGQLCIDSVTLAIGIFFLKQRCGNRISQSVNGPFQRVVFHFQIKRGAIGRGAGVMATTVHFQKFGEAIRLRVFFRAHQRHMLKIMGKAGMRGRVFKGTYRDDKCRKGFYRLGIGNQQYYHAVVETNRLILAGIFIALTDSFLYRLPTIICLTVRRPEGKEHNESF